jgi:hypothetical protein
MLNRRGKQAGNLAQLGAGVANGRGNRIGAQDGIGSEEREPGLGLRLGIALRRLMENERWLNGRGLNGLELSGLGLELNGRRVAAGLVKSLAGAGERVSLGVDQALDLKRRFDIAASVKPLAGSALVGL